MFQKLKTEESLSPSQIPVSNREVTSDHETEVWREEEAEGGE